MPRRVRRRSGPAGYALSVQEPRGHGRSTECGPVSSLWRRCQRSVPRGRCRHLAAEAAPVPTVAPTAPGPEPPQRDPQPQQREREVPVRDRPINATTAKTASSDRVGTNGPPPGPRAGEPGMHPRRRTAAPTGPARTAGCLRRRGTAPDRSRQSAGRRASLVARPGSARRRPPPSSARALGVARPHAPGRTVGAHPAVLAHRGLLPMVRLARTAAQLWQRAGLCTTTAAGRRRAA